MHQPLVSVICLCFNHEKFVIESLNSVLNQSYKNIELIVVDDKSNDNSTQIIDEWLTSHPQVKKIFHEKNWGNTKAFNHAAQFANGDYLIDLAADDVLLPDAVAKQINAFERSAADTAIVFGNAYLINEKGKKIGEYFAVDQHQKVLDKNIHQTDYQRIIGKGTVICSVSAMMKKSVFDALQGYNENLFFEDLDYWFRAARNHSIVFVDDFLVSKREVMGSLGSQFHKNLALNEQLNRSLAIIFNETLARNRNKNEHRALLQRIHQELILAIKFRNIRNIMRYTWLKTKTHIYLSLAIYAKKSS